MRIPLFITALAGLLVGSSATALFFSVPQPERFGGGRITQIAVVVPDIERAAVAYADLFGMPTPGIIITDGVDKANTAYFGEPTEARAKLAFLQFENITLELIEPIGEPSVWLDVLEEKGAGFHHIAFQVENMDEGLAHLQDRGGSFVQRGDFTGGSYAYVTHDELGMMFELLTSDE